MYQKIFPDRMKEISAYLESQNYKKNASEMKNKSTLSKMSNIVNDE